MRGRQRGREARDPPPSVGPGAAQVKPGVISEPRRDMPGTPRWGKGLRARYPSRSDWNGVQLRHVSIPTWRVPRAPTTWRWRCWHTRFGASTRKAPLA